MEVADQWRRKWAGTAEYGKVVEGGVTRRIARAMEVLHASGPGARVKVMRAAYHTTAGPGVPASSYMVHASRRVYSSGFNSGFLEPPSLPTEPLEISSTPLALLQDPHADTENYKVTEPDDFDISEPSKWRSSTGGSIRMPSEESSSTDNASIIDVSRNHKNVFRKYSCDSENSDIPLSGKSSRLSPLLDSPTLSTLKYKSLLNGNNDWNSRRKSYSFEDTSPLSETIQLSNDTLAMDSSTDSGICKSTEIVNDQADENPHIRYFGSQERNDVQDNSYESWLSNNKQNSYKGTKFKRYRDREVDDPKENITLQPAGKVTITLPVTLETEQEYETRKNYEEHQRKIKKVEFCKTELHFAAETGKVNIIATDKKPPPTNDFRKRRSAFVPMRDVPEKPIMLFGEKNDFSNETNSLDFTISEINEIDENTAATKSILKNKIPKPKPYLLGENMTFGTDELKSEADMSYVTTGVSLINKQLQAENRSDSGISASFSSKNTVSTNAFRTAKLGPQEVVPLNREMYDNMESGETQKIVRIHDERNSSKRTSAIVRSPTPARLKTRELRESDLTYFGVNNTSNNTDKIKQTHSRRETHEDDSLQHLFQSVKLIQQVSNSVCNSESEEAPEYQNINYNRNYVPKPTPRIRSKYDDKPNHIEEIVLNPIIEQATTPHDDTIAHRRSKSRRHEEFNSMKNRSRSEPRKTYTLNSNEKPERQLNQQSRSNGDQSSANQKLQVSSGKTPAYRPRKKSSDSNPIYINLKKAMPDTKESISNASTHDSFKVPKNNDGSVIKQHRKLNAIKSNTNQETDSKVITITKKHSINEDKNIKSIEAKNPKRNPENQQSDKGDLRKLDLSRQNVHSKMRIEHLVLNGTNKSIESKDSYKQINSTPDMKERRSRSSHRPAKKTSEDVTSLQSTKDSTDKSSGSGVKDHRRTSKDKTNIRNEPIVITKVGTNSSRISHSKDLSRHGNRQGRREIVINYDDKNGTVSSISKIRSGSGSPRRKKTSKDMVVEKHKESMKNKSSDKALLQFEDHQRNSNTMNGYKKKKKKHIDRSCQVL